GDQSGHEPAGREGVGGRVVRAVGGEDHAVVRAQRGEAAVRGAAASALDLAAAAAAALVVVVLRPAAGRLVAGLPVRVVLLVENLDVDDESVAALGGEAVTQGGVAVSVVLRLEEGEVVGGVRADDWDPVGHGEGEGGG